MDNDCCNKKTKRGSDERKLIINRLNRISGQINGITKNLQMSLKSKTIRVEAPIPGKETIGIEVPNITPDKVELEVEEGVMSARLETRMGVGIGDIVEFEVTDRDEDRITLKHIKQEKLDDKFDMRI